jgi:hypothetical protein
MDDSVVALNAHSNRCTLRSIRCTHLQAQRRSQVEALRVIPHEEALVDQPACGVLARHHLSHHAK